MTRALLALALLVPAAVPAPAAAAAPAPVCAWPSQVAADATNVALPDTSARYWVMPYKVYPDRQVVVTGRFPDDRYISLAVYDGQNGTFTSNGVSSVRTDFQIAADPGSVNPWQQPAAPGGTYKVTLKMQVDPAEQNVLPLAPADAKNGQIGYLIYRTYLEDGDGRAGRPTLTVIDGGSARVLPPCPKPVSTLGSGPAYASSPVFSRLPPHNDLFPNADSGYLSAWTFPPAGDGVVVVRGKAPQAPVSASPQPWPSPGDDVRYWSLCTNLRDPNYPVVINTLPDGTTDPGCRYDAQVPLDADGNYTFAVGTEAQRPRIEAIPGVAFVPFSLAQPAAEHLIVLRNMLPAPGFAEAITNVPQNGDPAEAATVMGAYYPTATTCDLTALATGGC